MAPHTIKWGIMATGGIADKFVRDLLTSPATRDVHDVAHIVAAVSSSSSVSRAQEFITAVGAPSSTKAYGSYADLVADPDVEIVYVATPHSHHFQNAMLALEAGKHVLCEKAFTVTVAQTKKLVEKAKEKGLFLMEAVWTRYFPLSIKIRELVKSGEIGDVTRVFADFSINFDDGTGKYTIPDTNRMINPDLAGGALLDLGIYSLTWVFQILYHIQDNKEIPTIVSAINKAHTGADENTVVIVQFPRNRAMGIATTSCRADNDPDRHGSAGPMVRIQGTKGEIQIMDSISRPQAYRIVKPDSAGKPETVSCPIPKDEARGGWGQGMFWEADECARCLRDGKKESDTLPLSESIIMMEVMEKTLQAGGVVYPDLITTDVYDAKSPLNGGKSA